MTSKNAGWLLRDTVEFSGLGGLIGNYDTVAKSRTPIWLYRRTCGLLGFLGGSDGKESACNARRPRFDPWVGKIPWRRGWLPTLVFSPGEFHGHKESDMTERLTCSLLIAERGLKIIKT